MLRARLQNGMRVLDLGCGWGSLTLWIAERYPGCQVLAETYGAGDAERWLQRWRLFFQSCAELFGYCGGNEWWVTHLRLRPRAEARPRR